MTLARASSSAPGGEFLRAERAAKYILSKTKLRQDRSSFLAQASALLPTNSRVERKSHTRKFPASRIPPQSATPDAS